MSEKEEASTSVCGRRKGWGSWPGGAVTNQAVTPVNPKKTSVSTANQSKPKQKDPESVRIYTGDKKSINTIKTQVDYNEHFIS